MNGTDPCAPAAAVAASATSAGATTAANVGNTMAVCMDVDAPDQSLPPLADICSKILGIGTAERSWGNIIRQDWSEGDSKVVKCFTQNGYVIIII